MLKKISIVLSILVVLSMFSLSAAGATSNQAGASQNYIVLYNQNAVPSDAASSIANAGGTLVYSYDAIGVAFASSADPAFRDNLLKDSRIQGASATGGFAVQLNDNVSTTDSANAPVVGSPAPGNDNLSALQWDMIQIHAPEARAINGGSPRWSSAISTPD